EYGRMALYFILKALNIPAGSEIIVPALTFWVVPEITRVAGLKPVFVDIDPSTFTMDPKAAERAITPNTRAILPTHLYGLPCDMAPIMELARKHKEGDRGLCAFARRHLPGSPDRILRGRQLLQLPGVQAAQHIRWGPRMGAGRRCREESVGICGRGRVAERKTRREHPAHRRAAAYLHPPARFHPLAVSHLLRRVVHRLEAGGEALGKPCGGLDPMPAHYRGRLSNVQAGIGHVSLLHLRAHRDSKWSRER